ncbi:LacI family DNA-binding transcriptional regulator [Coraliomargarita sp. SDUM461003]|uniref:LacI family DNA-binding transcriptional regulator n=1 Tax=Thalassobacterium maritimum TaxID=3041265 RepID=A0ABU1B1R5_9BACT|nr:LacI family DNA-binding transcriptional regulator [Coraliomargarita sp. SDUM461003]MDQ8209392.1 LacI family DNA-binding transcriptional regulator [Coraliomargarita sp. SDUM461003]
MPGSIPSLRDVAVHAGVSAMTASRVVRGLKGVKPATAERVHQAIEALGYRPDPLLTALAGRRKRKGHQVTSVSVALVTPGSDERVWRDQQGFHATVCAALKTAASFGYGVEFALGGDTLKSWERVLRMLFVRGVVGLFVPPVQIRVPEGIDWSPFSGVNLGYGVRRTGFDTVRHDNYQMVSLALDRLVHRGYQKIGVVLSSSEARTDYRVGGAALALGAWGGAVGKVLPPLMLDQPASLLSDVSRRKFLSWLRACAPDVILSLHADILLGWLTDAGIGVPEDVGVAGLNLNADQETPGIAGVAISPGRVGSAAAEMLHSMVLHGRTGRPVAKQILCLDGFWQDGCSIRAVGPELAY